MDKTTSVEFAKIAKVLLAMGIVYLLFVIYGSLVPLDYRYRPLEEAWRAFVNIPYLSLDAVSRADWVANILLYIPLAFLWLGVFWNPNSFVLKILASFGVLIACIDLSLAVEFTQLYFPPRTVSLNDLFAEAIGTGIGIGLWWAFGISLIHWFYRLPKIYNVRTFVDQLVYFYLFILILYSFLPFDLSFSLAEISQKWKIGKIVLIPFGYAFSDPAQCFYSLLAETGVWIPVGFLWRFVAQKRFLFIWLFIILTATLLECLQVFIYTKVTDITDILMASLGGATGFFLADAIPRLKIFFASTVSKIFPNYYWFFTWAAVLFAWFAVIAVAAWYPFDFRTDIPFIRARLVETFRRVPFHTYYWSTEYLAITAVLHKMGLFFPLGILLSLPSLHVPQGFWSRLVGLDVILFIAFIALVVEFGQTLLPVKIPDTTDWFLETLGGTLGYFGFRMFHRRFFLHSSSAGIGV